MPVQNLSDMNKITLIHSNNLATVDYAYAARVPTGMDIIFMAGACPLNKSGEVLHLNDYALQTQLCIENLEEALRECGASLKEVVYTRILVASPKQSDLVTAWNVFREYFDDVVPSTLTGVTVLGYTNQLVEIEAVAAMPNGDSKIKQK
jgi:enamine deaminase RidA (YjgF/YER057c/UK114 family)